MRSSSTRGCGVRPWLKPTRSQVQRPDGFNETRFRPNVQDEPGRLACRTIVPTSFERGLDSPNRSSLPGRTRASRRPDMGHRPKEAIRHYQAGFRIGELPLGEDFHGVPPWDWIDNRPVLRCMDGFGPCLWRLQEGRREDGRRDEGKFRRSGSCCS